MTDPDTASYAKERAADTAQSAASAGSDVAARAVDEAKNVAGEAQRQARDLLREARGQLDQQAHDQTRKASGSLRALGDELSAMADKSGRSGLATELAQQASGHAHAAASWLEQRDPGQLIDEVRDFARRSPGTFILGALLAGVVAGRLTRGAVAASSGSGAPRPAVPDWNGAAEHYREPGSYEAGAYRSPTDVPADPYRSVPDPYGQVPAYPAPGGVQAPTQPLPSADLDEFPTLRPAPTDPGRTR